MNTPPCEPPPRLSSAYAAAGVVLLLCAAFGNSFGGFFVMDDISEITMNPAMKTLLPPWRVMFVGRALPARPLPYLTFGIDHAAWGLDPFGYHFTNLTIHVAAALAVFGLTRLTLLSPRLRSRYQSRAIILSLIIAAVWAAHPLQTQAVTYVYQRIESLTGMLSLISLFCFARAAATSWNSSWLAGCVAATAAAMASKETAVVLPLLVASYDWLFSGEGMAGLRRRRIFYGCMSATWIVLVAVILSQAGRYGEFQKTAHDPLAYLLTQPRVILHYLRLAALPSPLCFDYIWRTVETWSEFLPSLVYVLALAALTVAGMVWRRPWAWLGIAFFLTLAPTSSIMPVVAVAAEHRMYLPLAACVATVVLGCDWLVQRRIKRQPGLASSLGFAAIVAAGLWIAILVVMTRSRNEVYATPGGIWMDVLAKQPTSTRALWNLAATCIELGDLDAALRYADECFVLNPRLPVFVDLAAERRKTGDIAGALQILEHGRAQYRAIPTPHEPAIGEQSARLATELHELSSPDDAGKGLTSGRKPIPGHSTGP